ncbi:MAG: prephenate dehydrogenase/arogenate dehydrogenase family protein [Polyangiaceae bacterium]
MHLAILGFGRFGRALGELARASHVDVSAFDPTATIPPELFAPTAEQAILSADIVIFAMPVAALESALALAAPLLRPDQLVLDVGSVKVLPSRLLEHAVGSRAAWCATHPLFGPTSLALGERPLRVIVCPNSMHTDSAKRARSFYESLGCDVLEQSAEDHDRAMARTHALTFFLAKGVLDAFGASPPPEFAPASFQGIARAIASVRADAGHLFRTLQIDNPYAADSRRAILDALVQVDRAIASDASKAASAAPDASLSIPDLGSKSPELREARSMIDDVDKSIMQLLAHRAELSRRAGAAKSAIGGATYDPKREAELLEARHTWGAELGLDAAAVDDVFDAILRFSRTIQRK